MREKKTKKWNWAKRLTRFRLKRIEDGETLSDAKRKVLTMENTVATRLTDFDPHMLTPNEQTTLEDWGALPARPVTVPKVHTGFRNWPFNRGDDE